MCLMYAVIVPIGFTGFLIFALWIWAVFDVISTDAILVRNLPKGMWVFLVIFVPTVGAIAWFLLGRPQGAGASLGGQRAGYEAKPWRPSPRGIEDAPEWTSTTAPSRPAGLTEESLAVRERKLLEREAELAKREAELAEPEGPTPPAPSDRPPLDDGRDDTA